MWDELKLASVVLVVVVAVVVAMTLSKFERVSW